MVHPVSGDTAVPGLLAGRHCHHRLAEKPGVCLRVNGRRCTACRSAQKPGFCHHPDGMVTPGTDGQSLTVCSSGFSELEEMPTSLVLSFTDHYHRNNNIKKKNILTGQT